MTSQNDLTLLQFFDVEDAKASKDGLNALYSTAVMRSTQALLSTAPVLFQSAGIATDSVTRFRSVLGRIGVPSSARG